MSPEQVAVGLVWYVVFLLAITCHEGAHAWAAKLGGDETAALGGQATLNPTAVMESKRVSLPVWTKVGQVSGDRTQESAKTAT